MPPWHRSGVPHTAPLPRYLVRYSDGRYLGSQGHPANDADGRVRSQELAAVVARHPHEADRAAAYHGGVAVVYGDAGVS